MSFVLEQNRLFSSSLLWKLQREYFEQMGFEAWRQGEVPHYVTTNPRIANSYAEMIFALYQEKMATGENYDEPFYIIEIGGGSGRFAYYLLKRLAWLCEQAQASGSLFRYILTDFTQNNADFWREHPCLQPFIEKGMLDMGIVDFTQLEEIVLQVSGQTICAGSLQQPVIMIANYLFDSIPQELFYCKSQQAHPCLVTLSSEENTDSLKPAQQLEKLGISYQHGEAVAPFYREPYLENLLERYRSVCDGAYFLFPDSAIRGLHTMASFSKNGMMLLTADKGDHIPHRVIYMQPPGIVRHGSFSYNVNYHALSMYCEMEGGTALFPEHKHGSINTGCLLFMKNAASLRLIPAAFRKYIAETGPDDYYAVYNQLYELSDTMNLSSVLSVIRISLYDSHQLNRYLPRLNTLAGEMSELDKIDVINLLNRCWENYYPLGEYSDLAHRIAMLLYEMDVYDWALYYFNLSIHIYGDDTGTLFNMAACYFQLGQAAHCKELLEKVLENDPSNTGAAELTLKLLGHEAH